MYSSKFVCKSCRFVRDIGLGEMLSPILCIIRTRPVPGPASFCRLDVQRVTLLGCSVDNSLTGANCTRVRTSSDPGTRHSYDLVGFGRQGQSNKHFVYHDKESFFESLSCTSR